MEKLRIRGGHPLHGRIEVGGAKNSAVAMIPAALLADSPTRLERVPAIQDVEVYKEMLQELGVKIWHTEQGCHIDPSVMQNQPLRSESVSQLRASYYLMGVLLGRYKRVTIRFPGGCPIQPRPIDHHLKAFQALGAEVYQTSTEIELRASQLKGARVYFDGVSVGATINLMLAAVLAEGKTEIINAAKEPEVIDVAVLLSKMGAHIRGAGTDSIRITGVERLYGCDHELIPDRIEAGTFMIAAAATGGHVQIERIISKHVAPLTAKLREIGVQIEEQDEDLLVIGRYAYRPTDIKTYPYPGFPTDLQPLFTSMLTQIPGTSLVTDTIYFSRFHHVPQLTKLGAKIKVEGRTAIVQGSSLRGTEVRAHDVRSAAALVIAGLSADQMTTIDQFQLIKRGYERLPEKLRQLGADLWWSD